MNNKPRIRCKEASDNDFAMINLSDLKLDFVQEHNKFRMQHDCPALEIDESMCKLAEIEAKKYAKKNFLKDPPAGYGVNTYKNENTMNACNIVQDWYSDIKDYNFDRPTENSMKNSFVKLIWKGTKKIGCGFAKRKRFFYVVALYDQPTYKVNEFELNVLREKSCQEVLQTEKEAINIQEPLINEEKANSTDSSCESLISANMDVMQTAVDENEVPECIQLERVQHV